MSDGIIPLSQAQFDAEKEKASKENFIERDLVAVDIAANVLTGGLEDQTISSRLANDAEHHEIVGEIGSKALDILQRDHGADAQAGDTERGEAIVIDEEAVDGNLH